MGSTNQHGLTTWAARSVERLLAAQDDSGAWGYRPGSPPSAEPTALASIALSYVDDQLAVSRRGVEWLARVQRSNGAVPVSNTVDGVFWPTAPAMLAWHRAKVYQPEYERSQIVRAADWLLKLQGDAYPPAPATFGHDTSLVGWPWVANTHSWIEPTSFAIRALSESGLRTHRRVLEGIELILDRALPEGGWNYGNTRVLTHMLRPFPATTGIALFGLAGEQQDARIKRSIDYLRIAAGTIRAPWSLSWALIGLSAWDAVPGKALELLTACAKALEDRDPNVLDDALMLWANALVMTK